MKTHKKILLIFVFIIFLLVPEYQSLGAEGKDRVDPLGTGLFFKLLKSREITTIEEQYRRPDVVLINDQMYISFANKTRFVLATITEDLDYTILGYLANPSDEFATDVRLATDGSNLWYAMETTQKLTRPECGKNFLNGAKYSIGKKSIKHLINNFHITSGCPTIPKFIPLLMHSPLLPEDAKAVDDPTPLFIDNHFFIMVRGWINKKKQYIYKFDENFNLIEKFNINLDKFIDSGSLSQNVLIEIEDQLYLIAGVNSGPPRGNNYSQIKAFPLSRDFKTVNGKIIDLISTNDQYLTRVTAAAYYKGKLIFNIVKKSKRCRKSKGYLAVLNKENSFQVEHYLLFQEHSAADNHSSFVIVNDKIFIFYQTPHKTIMAKVFSINSEKGINEQPESIINSEPRIIQEEFCKDGGMYDSFKPHKGLSPRDNLKKRESQNHNQPRFIKSHLCGDGYCDELEQRMREVCPQDCR